MILPVSIVAQELGLSSGEEGDHIPGVEGGGHIVLLKIPGWTPNGLARGLRDGFSWDNQKGSLLSRQS